MIITISGKAGSGKSTIAKILTTKLQAKRVYVGGIRRDLAKQMGMSLKELNEYAKTHSETDVDVDHKARDHARELEKQGNIVVVEGRPQFHFLPESIKIFMDVSLDEAARRIWPDLQKKQTKEERNEGEFDSLEQFKHSLEQRDAQDAARYIKYYGVDHRELSHYDLVVDTTDLSIEQAATKVLEFVKEKMDRI